VSNTDNELLDEQTIAENSVLPLSRKLTAADGAHTCDVTIEKTTVQLPLKDASSIFVHVNR